MWIIIFAIGVTDEENGRLLHCVVVGGGLTGVDRVQRWTQWFHHERCS